MVARKGSTVKERLHELVDLIDDDIGMEEALDYLRWLALEQDDDDPLTEEDWARIRESEAAIAAGRVTPWEEVKRQLDL
jgi:hypothetical protein